MGLYGSPGYATENRKSSPGAQRKCQLGNEVGIYMKQFVIILRFDPHYLGWMIAGLGLLMLQT